MTYELIIKYVAIFVIALMFALVCMCFGSKNDNNRKQNKKRGSSTPQKRRSGPLFNMSPIKDREFFEDKKEQQPESGENFEEPTLHSEIESITNRQ